MGTLYKGTNKLFKVKQLVIRVEEQSKGGVRLKVSIKNKFGEFVLYPHPLNHYDRLMSTGDTITICPDENFKLKTRIKIE